MPKMSTVEVQRLSFKWQEIPSVAREIYIHTVLRHYSLGSIENWNTIGFVSNAVDFFKAGLKVGMQEVV
jgi:hypothetical protein